MSKLILALAAATFLLLGAYLYLRPSPMIPMKNDPREVAKIIAQMQKARAAIHSSRGKVYLSESERFPDGNCTDRLVVYTANFDGGCYKVTSQERYVRSENATASLKQRFELFKNRLLNPRYSTQRLVSATYACDGKRITAASHGAAVVASLKSPAALRARSGSVLANILSWMGLLRPAGTERSINGFSLPYSITYYEPRIIGRQILRGENCFVVRQRIDRGTPGNAYESMLWICPAKSYSILRTQHWELQRGKGRAKWLIAESTANVRRCGRIWIPATIDRTYYSIRSMDKPQGHTRVEFAPNFQVNVPKSKLDLKLKLPSGARVHDQTTGKDYVVP